MRIVDSIELSTAGITAQLKVVSSTKKYRGVRATIHVDHYSNLSFVYPKHNNSRKDLLRSNIAFKHYAKE